MNELITGQVGPIELGIELPAAAAPRGIALIAHPHPLFGGTQDNKIVTTLARCFRDLGLISLRPNFRGVGQSAGQHDHGEGETEDLLAVWSWAEARWGRLPWVLAGFSFGAFVQTRVAKALAEAGTPANRLVLIGLAAGNVKDARAYSPEKVPANTLVIHGEQDDTVPLANVLDWARPQGLPVVVAPGVDHFFHGRLALIRQQVNRLFSGEPL